MLITFIIFGVLLLLFVFLVYRAKHEINQIKNVKDNEKSKILRRKINRFVGVKSKDYLIKEPERRITF
jgi:hypothetical protein